jgi:arylsulfatase A-like enzyme
MLTAILFAPLVLAAPGSRPNVLIIVADDLGVDKVGAYAADADPDYASRATALPQTPVMDQLASAGVRFTDAWANPNCSPTRASVQTGQHAFRHGVGSPNDPDLDVTATTLAHVAQDAGYASGMFGKWHLGMGESPASWTPGETYADHHDEQMIAGVAPRALGWDRFFGTVESRGSESYYAWTELNAMYRRPDHILPLARTDYATGVTTDRALDWITDQGGPWLAVVNYHAPHQPLEAPPASCGYTGDTSSDLAIFQAMTECLDQEIGVLLDGIDDLGETVVIFLGDNGTHSDSAEDVFDDGRGKGSVYENGVRVPLIITQGADGIEATTGTVATGPSIVGTPGITVSDPVLALDIFATVAAITGGDGSSGVDSISLEGATRFGAMPTSRPIYTEQFREVTGAAALRIDHWKLVVNASPQLGCRTGYELYQLSVDRFETHDLAAKETAVLAVMQAQLDTLLATGTSPWLDIPDCS